MRLAAIALLLLADCSAPLTFRLAPGATPAQAAAFRSGLAQWRDAGTGVSEGPGGWVVEIVDQERLPDGAAGITCEAAGDVPPDVEQPGWSCPSDRWIGLSRGNDDYLDPDLPAAIAAHEIGHALGLGHAPGSRSLMSPNVGSDRLTPEDLDLL